MASRFSRPTFSDLNRDYAQSELDWMPACIAGGLTYSAHTEIADVLQKSEHGVQVFTSDFFRSQSRLRPKRIGLDAGVHSRWIDVFRAYRDRRRFAKIRTWRPGFHVRLFQISIATTPKANWTGCRRA